MSYKKLEIWQLANELVIKIHNMTLHELPKFEMFEEGSQIRRSSKSVKSLIVEGYGRRAYKKDFIRFLINSLASNNETIDHLENLFNTTSLTDKNLYTDLLQKLEILGRKINSFISSVEKHHNALMEEKEFYQISNLSNPESNI
jgi:four helix bundle protein